MNRLQSIFTIVLLILLLTYCTREFHNPYDRDCPPEIWTPSNLEADTTGGALALTWKQSATHFDGFFIDRSSDSIQWSQVNPEIIENILRSYTDSTAYYGDTLFYRIYAQADLNTSGYSYTNMVVMPVNVAEVVTHAVSDVGSTAAIFHGEVVTDGGAAVNERGFLYGTGPMPDMDDNKVTSGDGVGTFSASVDELSPGVHYYVRAYGINSQGVSYGDVQEFASLDEDEGDVINPTTGTTWMDRNLGASRVATSITDAEAYGDLYQWGRAADGHQKRTSGTTSTLSSSNTPGHGYFITVGSHPFDWRSPQNNNLWQGADGVNNPCPPGYRLPTLAELNDERLSWSSNDAAGAFASPLKLPIAGFRRISNGSLANVDDIGCYWSGTVDGSEYARYLTFSSSGAATNFVNGRAKGYSVRCLKDNVRTEDD